MDEFKVFYNKKVIVTQIVKAVPQSVDSHVNHFCLIIFYLGETSKFTIESHKMLHKKPLLPSVSGVRLLYRAIQTIATVP